MKRSTKKQLLMAFYGDDFTGSTDALEALNNFGIKTMLFIEPPTPQQMDKFPDLQAIGIAGMSRSFSQDDMRNALTPSFTALAALKPKHLHYKVCSTFDSSPEIGSIGLAIDIGVSVFGTKPVPLLVAAPILGRYCLFGNLFARMGIGSDGEIYRLDRHPSMIKHPITPADESDLRLHLAKQTPKKIALLDVLTLKSSQGVNVKDVSKGCDILLFDALDQEDLTRIGASIDSLSTEQEIVFSVGSSGVEMALGANWQFQGITKAVLEWPQITVNGPVVVASGSCSATTEGQIAYALANGFEQIAIDTVALAELTDGHVTDFTRPQLMEIINNYVESCAAILEQKKSIIIHTSLGPGDERIAATKLAFTKSNHPQTDTAKLYGAFLGEIVKKIVSATKVQRVIVAGGDTSSYLARAMGIEAVEMLAPLSPGAPICSAHAPNSPLHRKEVVFKGGQVGKPDFFIAASK